jgi:iron complex outermembrane recepter protein
VVSQNNSNEDRKMAVREITIGRNKLAVALAHLNQKSGIGPALYSSTLVALMAAPAMAQTSAVATGVQAGEVVEEVAVTGLRATMTRSMDVKRENTAIVDAIAASDFGGLPGLSMSDVIENITSVSGHRGKGSASEMSIRGLGPFLGYGTFNSRTVTSAGFSRAVNYKKFPSDLSDKVVVYKSQQADLIEGGVAGTINIDSLRPLDYGRRKITVEASAIYNEISARQTGESGMGDEETFSYVDQFESDRFGKFGVTFGFQRTDSANPEESTLTSSNLSSCAAQMADGTGVTYSKRCDDAASPARVTRDNYENFQQDSIYLRPQSFTWRNQGDGDYREGYVGALQWQPNDRWDINLDIEASDNSYFEDRHDFVVSDARYDLRDEIVGEDHSLLYSTGRSKMETQGYYRLEEESYRGWGLNTAFEASDNLTLWVDLSYSKSHRDRSSFQSRLGTNNYWNYSIDNGDSIVSQIEFLDANRRAPDDAGYDSSKAFDPNSPDSWSLAKNGNKTSAKYRRQLEERFDTIKAARFDGEFKVDNSAITSVKAGVRYSQEELYSDNDTDTRWDSAKNVAVAGEGTVTDTASIQKVLDSCFIDWNNSDWFGSEGGSGFQGGKFAQLDGRCGFGVLSGYQADGSFKDFGKLPDRRSPGDDVIDEDVFAAYVMANFEGKLFNTELTGNIGTRVVNTKVTSTGYYSAFSVSESAGVYSLDVVPNTVSEFTSAHSVTTVLPSTNVTFYLNEDLLLRAALYRSMSRPDLQDMGSGRIFKTSDADVTDPNELITSATGDNPNLEPLLSDNGDISLEWYPSKDSSISLAYYYKKFNANFRAIQIPETITVDGIAITTTLTTDTYTDDSATLTGWELSAQHSFNYLPAPFDGFGTKISYNYADSDFENQDGTFGETYDYQGNLTDEGFDFVAPANLFGFSKNVFSGSIFWENDDWEIRALYKYRSKYFQPNTGAASNRYVEPFEYVDVSISYNILKNLEISLQGLNVLDEAQYMTRGVEKTPTLVSSSGPKYYLKLKATF